MWNLTYVRNLAPISTHKCHGAAFLSPHRYVQMDLYSWNICSLHNWITFYEVITFHTISTSSYTQDPSVPRLADWVIRVIYHLIFKLTVVFHSKENFSFKWELPACLFPSTIKEVQQRKDGCKIGNYHLNKMLSFKLEATVPTSCLLRRFFRL